MKVSDWSNPELPPYLKVQLNDANGKWLTNLASNRYDLDHQGQWQKLVIDCDLPPNAPKVSLAVGRAFDPPTSGTILLDDLESTQPKPRAVPPPRPKRLAGATGPCRNSKRQWPMDWPADSPPRREGTRENRSLLRDVSSWPSCLRVSLTLSSYRGELPHIQKSLVAVTWIAISPASPPAA